MQHDRGNRITDDGRSGGVDHRRAEGGGVGRREAWKHESRPALPAMAAGNNEGGMTNLATVVVVALTLFGEAAGEPLAGKQAVASVIHCRAQARGTGGLVGVCKAPRQFSCWNAGTPVVPDDALSWRAYRQCWLIADSMVRGDLLRRLMRPLPRYSVNPGGQPHGAVAIGRTA